MKLLILTLTLVLPVGAIAQTPGFDPAEETIRQQRKQDTEAYLNKRRTAEALRKHKMLQHEDRIRDGSSSRLVPKPLNQIAPETMPE